MESSSTFNINAGMADGPSGTQDPPNLEHQPSLKRRKITDEYATSRRKAKLQQMLSIQDVYISKLNKQLTAAKCKLRNLVKQPDLENFFNDASCENSELLLISQASQKKQWKLWSEAERKVLISLYLQSPTTFVTMKTLFKLPGKATLCRWLHKMNISDGISLAILDALKQKVKKLPEIDRYCILSLEEIGLGPCDKASQCLETIAGKSKEQQVANCALVVTVKGIFHEWKQLLMYHFVKDCASHEILSALITDVVSRLRKIGIVVKVLVCDQNRNQRLLYNSLGVTVEKPWVILNKIKVFCLFNAPHLLKDVRDSLKKHDLSVNGNLCKWQYIQEFYVLDTTKHSMRLVPELTNSHVYLPVCSNLNVKLAAETLSHNVGSKMGAIGCLGALTNDAKPTWEFILQVAKWFEIFTSNLPTKQRKEKVAKRKAAGNLIFLTRFLEELQGWKFNTVEVVPAIRGLKISTSGLLAFWRELKETERPDFLLVSQLSQDSLEGQLAVAPSIRGNREGLPPAAFRAVFQNLAVNDLLSPIASEKSYNQNGKEFIRNATTSQESSYLRSKINKYQQRKNLCKGIVNM